MRLSRRKFLSGGAALAFAAPAIIGRARAALSGRPFANSSPWNTLIPSRSIYTPLAWPTATGFNYSVNWLDFSPAVYESNPAVDPLVTTTYTPSWGNFGPTVQFHIPIGVTGAAGTDGEVLIIDSGIVYNMYQFDRTSNTTATANAYASCGFADSGFGTLSPFLGAGTVAIGASELGGLLNELDWVNPTVDHALGLAVDVPLALAGFVYPAIAGDGSSSTGLFQEGQLLGIPSSTAMPGGLTPLGQKVFVAMQRYGAIVNDRAGGTTVIRAQANSFDLATTNALAPDMNLIVPLLELVSPRAARPQGMLLGVGP